ncbi:hypothetical protein COY27_02965 [Candidatus Woesearchaeota archaeon CG_4_10_14_0_2_um_filter_33_13]|nr:MAG: hypothetical protein COY27_02965 [Candidatus Woesearchaeota archaeon CG_4_10_14_0_2_um_filter_33_13]
MNEILETLAKRVYDEYNSGRARNKLSPEALAIVEMACGQGPDVYACIELKNLRPGLDWVAVGYRIETSAVKDYDCPKRTVPAFQRVDGKVIIVDPFIVDFVPEAKERSYELDEGNYPLRFRGEARIIRGGLL